MKNYKAAAIILTITIGLIGAGYGYWTNKVEMKNTILTGNLKMELVKSNKSPYYPLIVPRGEYLEASINISPNDNTAEVNIKKFYPNTYLTTDLQIKNVGTIPAKIKDIKIECDNEDLAKYIKCDIALGFNEDGENYNRNTKYETISGVLGEDLAEELNRVINDKSFIIYPKGYVVFGMPNGISRGDKSDYNDRYIKFSLLGDAPNEIKNKNVNIKISINFEQF